MREVPCPFCKKLGVIDAREFDPVKSRGKRGLHFNYERKPCAFCSGSGWIDEEKMDLLDSAIARIRDEYGG